MNRPGARALAVAALLVAACQATPVQPGAVIDGWMLGEPVACEEANLRDGSVVDVEGQRCQIDAHVAERGLDELHPWHLPVFGRSFFYEADAPVTTSGPIVVVVFTLADGSVRAVGSGHAGLEGPLPFGPDHEPMWLEEP